MSHEFQTTRTFYRLSNGFINLVYTDGKNVYVHFLERSTVSRPLIERFEYSIKFLKEFGDKVSPKLVSTLQDHRKIVAMRKVEGTNQKELLKSLEECGKTELLKEAYFQTGATLRIIHDTKNPDGISVSQYSDWFQQKTLEDSKLFFDLNKCLPPNYKVDEDQFSRVMIKKVLPSTIKTINSLPYIPWRHGDFWSNNIIGRVENDHYVLGGVIDPEFSCAGTPSEDLAQLSAWEFMEGGRDQYIKDFEAGYGDKVDLESLVPFYITNALDWLKPVTIDVFNEDLQKAAIKGSNPDEQFCPMSVRLLQKYIKLLDG